MESRIYTNVLVDMDSKNENRTNVIYCLTFPNGKKYIGLTTQLLSKRLKKHCFDSFNEKGEDYNNKKSRAIRKYKSFSVEILYEGENLQEKEISLIALYDTMNTGYNTTAGGDGCLHRICSDESRMKMSKSHLGKVLSDETKELLSIANSGENHYFYGQTHSEETKAKISNNRKGKYSGSTHHGATAILQFSLDGMFIREWSTIAEATKCLKVSNITRAIQQNKTAGGFKWQYKQDNNTK